MGEGEEGVAGVEEGGIREWSYYVWQMRSDNKAAKIR